MSLTAGSVCFSGLLSSATSVLSLFPINTNIPNTFNSPQHRLVINKIGQIPIIMKHRGQVAKSIQS